MDIRTHATQQKLSRVSWIAFRALLLKELKTLSQNPFTYAVIGLYIAFYFLLMFVFIFLSGLMVLKEITKAFLLTTFFLNLILASPVMAREERMGTLGLLLGAPMSDIAIILAKYSTLFIYYSITILLTLPAYVYLYMLTVIPFGELILQYLIMFLFGTSVLALGVLFSTLVARETTAAILGLCFALFAIFLNGSLTFFPNGVRESLAFLILLPQTTAFMEGVFTLSHIVYFMIYTSCALVCSTFALRLKRWN